MSAFASGMEHSTIVDGQKLGTVHIMEGTCSRLRFFIRNMSTDMYMYTEMYMNTYRYMYMCVYVCVFVFFCCVVPCHVVCRRVVDGWVVGCGVVLSMCLCRGGLCPCVVVPLIASSLKNKKKEQERNGAKVAEQVV